MNRLSLLVASSLLAGCVIQTETVPGPAGETGSPGLPGKDGTSPWLADEKGISYVDGNVCIGASDAPVLLTVRAGASGSQPSSTQDKIFVDSDDPQVLLNLASAADGQVGVIFSDSDERGVGNLIYDHATDSLYFSTASGANGERMRIDSGGNVGIGTSTPGARLDVSSEIPGFAQINLSQRSSVGGESGGVVWQGYYNGTTTLFDAAAIKRVNIEDNNGSSNAQRIGLFLRDPVVNGLLVERVSIRENGNVGIGTSDPQGKLTIDATGLDSTSLPAFWIRGLNNDAMTYAMAIGDEDGSGDLFALRSQGTGAPGLNLYLSGQAFKPGGGSWMDTSDVRLKKDVHPLLDSLQRLLLLRGVTYKWREPEKHAQMGGVQIGMIAQDVEKVFPEWVGVDPNGYKTVGFRGFEALTVEGFRELKSENDRLKQANRDLNTKLERVEERLARLERLLSKTESK